LSQVPCVRPCCAGDVSEHCDDVVRTGRMPGVRAKYLRDYTGAAAAQTELLLVNAVMPRLGPEAPKLRRDAISPRAIWDGRRRKRSSASGGSPRFPQRHP